MDQAFINDMPNRNTEHDKFILSEFNVIGREDIVRTDGYEKATGKAMFTRDVKVPGMLYAKMLTSPHANCIVKSIDISAAEKLPGVRDIIVYDDSLPFPAYSYECTEYHPLSMEATFAGQPIACAVVADTEEIVDNALELVEIEYELRPFVLDVADALKPGAPLASPELNPNDNMFIRGRGTEPVYRIFDFGDVKEGFDVADHTIEIDYNRTELAVAGVEAHSTIASWSGPYLDVYVHHQWPNTMMKMWIHDTFGVSIPYIRTTCLYNGATFGVGCSNQWFTAYVAILCAKRTGRPVKCMMDGDSHFIISGNDLGRASIKVGYKSNGEITAVDLVNIIAKINPTIGIEHLHQNTKIPNLKAEHFAVFVNRGNIGAFRSERRPCTVISNQVFDIVASNLGVDPVKLAVLNDGCEGVPMAQMSEFKNKFGFPNIDSLAVCLEKGKAAIDWDNKWHQSETKQLTNGKMHGMGFAWDHEWDSNFNAATCGIVMQEDGRAQIFGMHQDGGLNQETALCQIAADEIGLKYEDVVLRPFYDTGFEFAGPATSTGMCVNGYVVRKAARQIKQKLLEMATTTGDNLSDFWMYYTPFPEKTSEELDIKDGIIFEKNNPENCLAITDMYRADWPLTVNPSGYCWKQHEPIFAYGYRNSGLYDTLGENKRRLSRQAYFCEVEVDTETGVVDIKQVVAVNDVGKAINPRGCRGQQYGGVYMAMGRGVMEEVIYDEATGVKLNDNLIDYKVTLMNDVGLITPILVESSLGYGPYGAEGLGECPADVAMPLVANAVYNATGVRITDLPVTPQKILNALARRV